MHKNKAKGTIYEHDFKNVLKMLSFEIIRAYSSIGTADLIASPPWNIRKNNRTLLIQNKNQKNGAYLSPFETSHIDHLQQRNAGMVIIAFKDKSKCMIKIWETQKIQTFEEFVLEQYGIQCKYSQLLKNFKEYRRPIHLYALEKESYIGRDGSVREKPISPFCDALSVDFWYCHVPEHFNKG